MTSGFHRIVSCLAIALLGVSMSGCGSDSDTASSTQATPPTIPDQVTMDDQEWTRIKEMTPAQEAGLNDFFQKEPSLAENPIVSGNPAAFESSSGAHRYVWIEGSDEATNWLYVQVKGGKWETSDGTGPLFK